MVRTLGFSDWSSEPMTFQSFSFLAFFVLVLSVCLLLGRKHPRAGKTVLSAASAVFYLWSFSEHVLMGFGVLAAGTAVTIIADRALRSETEGRKRRNVLTAAICWHVAVLLVFKYTGFFTGGAVQIGWTPLGLSFFTFQQIWYLKEVYTGQWQSEPMENLCLFSFFFPTVSSGPILWPESFFPQLKEKKFLHPGWDDVAAGLYAISCGMAKKVLLADPFGVIVDNGWAGLTGLNVSEAWLMILGYTLQLYFDFSGYCDIAAGLARLLGLRLPVNFDSPYRSLSIGEFWKRWHITLTSFLRECIYFPLGGSRRGTVRTYINILLIFLISGFWHGAGWTFIFWGLLHGIGQIVERLWGKSRNRLPAWVRWGMTFLFVNIAWVFFRAPSLPAALKVLKSAVAGGFSAPGKWMIQGFMTGETDALQELVPMLGSARYALFPALLYGIGLLAVFLPGNTIRRMDAVRPTFWRGVAIAFLLAWSVLSFTGITTFIYSNF